MIDTLELTDFDGRPDDCECDDISSRTEETEIMDEFDIETVELDVPCWPCAREGFDDPNPEADR